MLHHTWLKYFVIRAVGHIEAAQLDGNLVASSFAHCEGDFDDVGLWFLKNLLCYRDVQSQLNMGDVDPETHRPVGREGLTVLIEELSRHKCNNMISRGHGEQKKHCQPLTLKSDKQTNLQKH